MIKRMDPLRYAICDRLEATEYVPTIRQLATELKSTPGRVKAELQAMRHEGLADITYLFHEDEPKIMGRGYVLNGAGCQAYYLERGFRKTEG